MTETPDICEADRPHCPSGRSRVRDEVRAIRGEILLIAALGSSLLTSLVLQRPWVTALGTILVITGTLGIGLFLAVWFRRSFRQVRSSAPSAPKLSIAIGAAVLLAVLFGATMGGFVLIDERTASSPQAWSLFAMIAGLAVFGVALFALKLRRLADADGSIEP